MVGRLLTHVRQQWMGALALFLVLTGGVAYAADTIGSRDIIDGQVKTPDLDAGAVKSGKIADDEVTTADIGVGAVGNAELGPNAVAGGKVLNGSLQGVDVLNDSLGGADIDESTLAAVGIGDPAGGDLAGNFPNPRIAARAIGARHFEERVLVSDSELIPAGGVSSDVRAQCPTGAISISGGGYWDFPSGQLSGIRNYGAGVLADGTNRGTAAQYLHAFAYCLPN